LAKTSSKLAETQKTAAKQLELHYFAQNASFPPEYFFRKTTLFSPDFFVPFSPEISIKYHLYAIG